MTQSQLRQAMSKLNGERNVKMVFQGYDEPLHVANAFLVPEEEDTLVKLTDGRKEYAVDAERVIWIEIG